MVLSELSSARGKGRHPALPQAGRRWDEGPGKMGTSGGTGLKLLLREGVTGWGMVKPGIEEVKRR